MPDVTIEEITTALPWLGATPPKLRVFASVPFLTPAGELVPQGSQNGYGVFRVEAQCEVVGGFLKVPAIVLPSTEDSTRPDATYTAWLYSVVGSYNGGHNEFGPFAGGFRVPASPLTTTWEDLLLNMTGPSGPLAAADRTIKNLTVEQSAAIGANLSWGGVATGNAGGLFNLPGTPDGPQYESLQADASLWAKYQADGGGVGRFDVLRGDPGASVFGIDPDGNVDVLTPKPAVRRLFRGIGVFNVLDYLAVGDGTTDDTSAINDAIDALNTRGRGELQLPAGDYKVTAALHAITAEGEAIGAGRAQTRTPPTAWGTRVKFTSPTAVLFTASGARFTFSHLHLENIAGSTPTAGAAIKATHATDAYAKVDYESVSVYRFYDGLDVEVGNDWTCFNSAILDSVRYGAHIRNEIIPDTGGWAFVKCAIVGSAFTGIGIYAESCGGAKILNTNILAHAQAVKTTGTSTGILGIVDCNFENLSGIPVELAGWHSIRILGVEFGMWDVTNVEAIKITGAKNGHIDGCVFNIPSGGFYAINLVDCEGIRVGDMHPGDYHHLLTFSGSFEIYAEGNAGRLGPLTLLNSWADVAGFAASSFALVDGRVELILNVSGGTLNSTIYQLPAGFRPKAKRKFKAWSAGGGDCGVTIDTNGDITQTNGVTNGHLALDIAFRP